MLGCAEVELVQVQLAVEIGATGVTIVEEMTLVVQSAQLEETEVVVELVVLDEVVDELQSIQLL